jgi:transcriptional regulator with XRE-family HTH domain
MTLGKQIGGRLDALMSEQGMTNLGLAELLTELRPGSTASGWRSQLIAWRTKGRMVSPANAELLAQALGVDVSEFLPAQVTQADHDRVVAEATRAQAEHEAEMRRLREEMDRTVADALTTQRQPREMPKPGSRTKRKFAG